MLLVMNSFKTIKIIKKNNLKCPNTNIGFCVKCYEYRTICNFCNSKETKYIFPCDKNPKVIKYIFPYDKNPITIKQKSNIEINIE